MLMTPSDPWETRFDWILAALQWSTLALGAVLSMLRSGIDPATVTAVIAAGGYAVVMQVAPREVRNSQSGGEMMSVLGVLASLVAIAVTGGLMSPYVLFLTVPTFFASAFLGFRVGVETALVSIAGLAVVVVALGQDVFSPAFFQVAAFYALLAVAFSQAHRILIEQRARTDELERASLLNADRVERLSTAHSLLVSLSELAYSAELNPVTVGQAALRDLALTMDFRGGEVWINDDERAVVVARRGAPGPTDEAAAFPIRLGDRKLGSLLLWPQDGDTLEAARPRVEAAMRPVALAFDNILLLQNIAHRAVREERARLSRSLHDDIGPALASLGLGLDMGIQQHDTDPALARHLEGLRHNVTGLVDQVRRAVADLRSDEAESLVEQAHALAAEVGAEGPSIFVSIDERRPPRSAVALEVGAIMAEAVRNALEHGYAKSVFIEGYVDRDEGHLVVRDDGAGFDDADLPKGHFGLIGMRERADEIEARLLVSSTPGTGSSVSVTWGG